MRRKLNIDPTSIDPNNLALKTEWAGERLFVISSELGYLAGSFDPPTGYFYISDLEVRPVKARGHGVGKKLLEASKEEARRAGAKYMWAIIMSREALDAMTSVFGDESVRVDRVGEYADPTTGEPVPPEKATHASLFYELKQV